MPRNRRAPDGSCGLPQGEEKADGTTLVLLIGKFLSHQDVLLCAKAAEFLGTFGSKAKSEEPRLIEVPQDAEFQVVATCIWALGQVEGKAEESHLAALAKFLKSDEAIQRARAVQFLGGLGTVAKSQIPAPDRGAEDSDAQVVVAAVHGLAQRGKRPRRQSRTWRKWRRTTSGRTITANWPRRPSSSFVRTCRPNPKGNNCGEPGALAPGG